MADQQYQPTSRHEDELAIEDALAVLQRVGRAKLSDGNAKRMRYALEGALLAVAEEAADG